MNKVLNELFNELVPASGKADSLAGEIVRAVSRIGYRFFNDGDRVNQGYGKETCNPAARFLVQKAPEAISERAARLWASMMNDEEYEKELDELCQTTYDVITAHPELKQQETGDMWDWYDENEDRDDSWDDEYEDEEYMEDEAYEY